MCKHRSSIRGNRKDPIEQNWKENHGESNNMQELYT